MPSLSTFSEGGVLLLEKSILHLNIHTQIQLPVNAWERFSINPRKSQVLWLFSSCNNLYLEHWRWILNIQSRARNSCLAELKELSCRAEATSPKGQPKCAGDVCMYVFVHLWKCLRMSAFVHVPQRLLWCVCVPCVQPAGTVWGLFFSGPAENWDKAGRMGLPPRPWRVWRSFYSLHNQDNLPKTCWSFSVKLGN